MQGTPFLVDISLGLKADLISERAKAFDATLNCLGRRCWEETYNLRKEYNLFVVSSSSTRNQILALAVKSLSPNKWPARIPRILILREQNVNNHMIVPMGME